MLRWTIFLSTSFSFPMGNTVRCNRCHFILNGFHRNKKTPASFPAGVFSFCG